ncbi:MAG: hypothetical protein KBA03_00295 [Anaerolineaceae bacterium]|nr:hypothetical protein [Anaerolineaceae bacterium]
MATNGNQIVLTASIVLFLAGILCLVLSVFILAKQALNKDVHRIAEATTNLAEKGITDGVSGLVGNASLLIDSLNELSKSNSGIGVFFVFLSLALFAVAYFIIKPLIGTLP